MGTSPLVPLFVIVVTVAFQGLLYGTELANQSFPSDLFEYEDRDCEGFFDGAACIARAIYDFLRVVVGIPVLFWNLGTFNVPGAPTLVRVLIGGMLAGCIVWTLAEFFRGN